jgi:hypothetical protein
MYEKKWTSLRLTDVYPNLEEGFTGGVLDNYNRNWFFKSKLNLYLKNIIKNGVKRMK